MYMRSADALILATSIRNNVIDFEGIEIVLCPPAIWLSEIARVVPKGGKIELGGQNIYFEEEGPYTGEISPLMLKDIANYVIIGHSERREFFGETDFDVNEKVLSAVSAGLVPIICVGERKRKNNPSEPINELKNALEHLPKKFYKDIIVAYEPVWAISSKSGGIGADPEYSAKIITKLREIVHFETPILYGGSVTAKNAESYAKRPEIDGVLVGGASLRATEFVKICRAWSLTKSFKGDLFEVRESKEEGANAKSCD